MSCFGSKFLLAKPAGCKVAGCSHPHPFAQVHRLMMTTMKKSIHDNANGLNYTLVNDHYLPNLTAAAPTEHPTGRWGRLHKMYLKEQHPIRYNQLLLSGELGGYLTKLDKQAEEQLALMDAFLFDLNVFFSAKGKGRDCRFVYEDYVQKWLDLIRGSYLETTVDELKLGAKKPALPFADSRLLNVLQHTLWFLPNVASCYAMANLLADRKNTFYHDYRINVCAGTEAGIGAAALEPVQRSMGDPLETKTITLSCGKLTTGVTVKPWTGIFMLRNLSSPETYFQAAFRVQSPWEVTTDKGQKEIIKKECYVFDFALNRALRQISDYSCRLNIHEGNPEKKVAEFISAAPIWRARCLLEKGLL